MPAGTYSRSPLYVKKKALAQRIIPELESQT
jgi:hypothetical protein